ncbi:hydroxymethylbilane synthase [Clostridium sp. D2Q-11]|uniref:Porphobilinogen deaminase n=1 Tax=Anaeromonas frigoriresistens TaxID=2683708 RepID=A0A942Z967_9FIRM|nr:hydroxymethylbilane synthase [Anaeromonas frigoriresistens]MBS4538580.1 hydroxymethylbilane synthase [Anaeromonas frigoriresistens]
MKIVVGSRGSKLALTQTKWVIDQLRYKFPYVDFQIKIIKTKGDIIQNISLDKIGDKGLFVKEIENSLLSKSIDMAIHSMKDMPSVTPKGLIFTGIPKREDPRDALVLKEGYKSLEDLPKGARIGTGSKRRKYQLLKVRPDLDIVSIRGNIETRIEKIHTENFHGIILAAAGLHRLGLNNRISMYLSPEVILPAPAQGSLAIEICDERKDIYDMVKEISCRETMIQVKAEREFLKGVNGGCHIPVGALCTVIDDKIILDCIFGDEEGNKLVRKTKEGKIGEEQALGIELAQAVIEELTDNEG